MKPAKLMKLFQQRQAHLSVELKMGSMEALS